MQVSILRRRLRVRRREFVSLYNLIKFRLFSDCGAHFTNSTGSYDFEMSPSNISSICDFSFNIPAANSAVRINFTAFDKFTQVDEGPTDCATTVSNLTLYDGQNDNAPIFATFCGDLHSVHAPLGNTPITMTSSAAMMRFRGTQGKFSIAWETMERSESLSNMDYAI